MSGIYLDNNATTEILPEVRQAMLPFLESAFGNPNSIYELGVQARAAIERSRHQVAQALGVGASEITFTGSGTEADNQALLGVAFANLTGRKKIVISALEHSAVKETAKWLGKFGFSTVEVPFVAEQGRVSLAPFSQAIDEETLLVSVMAAHNETGILFPLPEIAQHCKKVGALLHSDAIQAFGKIAFSPEQIGLDMVSISAHKCHGPKGVGALWVRRGLKLEALVHGGPQENQRRAGTENVAGIVGFGAAAALANPEKYKTVSDLRDRFEAELLARFGKRVMINFQDFARLPQTSSVQFVGMDGNILLIKLDRAGVFASSGSACHSRSLSVSKSLLAMGLTEKEARGSVRFSLSPANSAGDIDQTLQILVRLLT